MVRKKSKRSAQMSSRRIRPLPTVFECPFCSHEDACDVKFNRKIQRAQITCRVCLEAFQTNIHYLSEPIDVYNAWIDACEEANRNQPIIS